MTRVYSYVSNLHDSRELNVNVHYTVYYLPGWSDSHVKSRPVVIIYFFSLSSPPLISCPPRAPPCTWRITPS